MKFNQLINPLRQVGPNKFTIGTNPLEPQLEIDGNKVHIPTTLTISGVDFLEYFTGNPDILNLIQNTFTDLRYTLEEAFELDENGDVAPSNAAHIADPMWILRSENDLELRSNHWRYNSGPEAFTDEISF